MGGKQGVVEGDGDEELGEVEGVVEAGRSGVR